MTNPLWVEYRRHWLRPLLERRGRLIATSLPVTMWPPAVLAGEKKECYRNALTVTLRLPGRFVYCEGLAERISVNVVAEHGWIFDRESGAVIDPTWGADGRDFAGVGFSSDFIQRQAVEEWNDNEGTKGSGVFD